MVYDTKVLTLKLEEGQEVISLDTKKMIDDKMYEIDYDDSHYGFVKHGNRIAQYELK